ncbi:MAG: hypothetical protein P0120_05940 [Nitrospira sp.]|nr:hypothetical protein [Nitrospira sp.]
MKDEYWATFSIYDHRKPLYRQALVFFDRIIVPIPTRPFKSITEEEIEQLSTEVDFLKKRGVADKVDWDPDEFELWRDRTNGPEAGHAEALARRLVNAPPFLTRLQLKEKTDESVARLRPQGVLSVTTVPVYGTKQAYKVSTDQLKGHITERVTLVNTLWGQILSCASR